MILAVSGPLWGLLVVIYFVLLVVLGVTSLRKGHCHVHHRHLHPAVLDHRRRDAAGRTRLTRRLAIRAGVAQLVRAPVL